MDGFIENTVMSILSLCRYVKFDTFHPAVSRGLPVTRVISRVVLQNILAAKCEELAGDGVICNGKHVVDYQEGVSSFHL